MRPGQRTGRGAALVSIDGAGRSTAHREGQDQRYAAVSLSGPSAAAEEQDRTASEAALRGVVPSRVRRAALRLDQYVCRRSGGREFPYAARLFAGSSSRLRTAGAGVNRESGRFSVQLRTVRWEPRRCHTVEAILRTVERKYGKARRVWIFDRG